MFMIGEVSPENKALCHATQESLYAAIKKVKAKAFHKHIAKIFSPCLCAIALVPEITNEMFIK